MINENSNLKRLLAAFEEIMESRNAFKTLPSFT